MFLIKKKKNYSIFIPFNFILNKYNIIFFEKFFFYFYYNPLLTSFFFISNNITIFSYFNYFYLFIYYKNLFHLILKSFLYNNFFFLRYKFFLKIGLSFRKKYSFLKNEFYIYFGLRHWMRLKPFGTNFFFNIRKRNILNFASTKNDLHYYSSIIKHLRKESVFKTKGIFFRRIWIRKRMPRAILFARRVKFFKLKLKLSKKQKTM